MGMKMREIKFRGWDSEHGCWRFGWLTRLTEGIRRFVAIIVEEPDGSLTRYYIHDDKTIEQFTGHMDSDGQEIFEGDIIEWFDVTGFDDGIGVVTWVADHAGFFVENDNTNVYDEIYNFTPTSHSVRVIGNIHQNPELLEAPNV